MVEKKRVAYFRRGKCWGKRERSFGTKNEKSLQHTFVQRLGGGGVEERDDLPPNPTLHRLLLFFYSGSGLLEVLNVLVQ